MINAINGSTDLAAVLNAAPGTAEDAAENPRDWLAGIWVAGTVYPLDPSETTETLAVLTDGTAASRWSPAGEWCSGAHRVGTDYSTAHWCVADVDSWAEGEGQDAVRGVDRDWRTIHVWDANGYSESTVHDTIEAAKAAFAREEKELRELGETLRAAENA